MKFNRVLLLGFLGTLFSAQLHAALIVYTDRSAWNAVVGAQSMEVFSASSHFGNLNGFSISQHGNISGPTGSVIADGSGTNNVDGTHYWHGIVDAFLFRTVFPRLNFHAPIAAFGADWASTTDEGRLSMNIGGEIINFSDHLPTGDGFLGIVSDTLFSTIGFDHERFMSNELEVFGMDNVAFSTEASFSVSVPGIALLMGLGLAMLRGRMPGEERT